MKKFFEIVAAKNIWSFLLLALVGSVFNFPGTTALPLMDRDEPKFAQATWEMMETRQFTIPYFNQQYRFDKPPLTYWWMRLHYHLLGKTELAARLHSIIAGILTGYVIYLFGSFLYSRLAGLLSGLAWLTCLQVLVHSRLCVADMPMLLGVTITMYAVARLLFSEAEPRRFGSGFWLLVGGLVLGFLAKGPVAWIIPGLALLLWRWPMGQSGVPWRRLQPFSSLLIAIAVVGAWGIPALIETKGAYWDSGVGEHVVKRGLSPFNGRINVPFVFYLGSGILSLLPWTAFLPGAITLVPSKLKSDRKRSFLTAWFLAPFLVFSLYATQLPHYILPGFPGVMLLLFSRGGLTGADTTFRKRWFWSMVGLMGLVSLLVLSAGLFRWFPAPLESINRLVLLAGMIITAIGVLLPIFIEVVRRKVSRWPLLLIPVVLATGITHVLSTSIREVHPITMLQKEGVFADNDEVTYFAQGFAEPSWVFYEWNGKPWILGGTVEQGAAFLEEPGTNRAGTFLTEEWRIGEVAILAGFKGKEVPHLTDQRERVSELFNNGKYQITKISGLNIARTTWVSIWFVKPVAP